MRPGMSELCSLEFLMIPTLLKMNRRYCAGACTKTTQAFTCFMLLCLVTTGLFAQRESLLIGSGDLLRVQVFDTPELEEIARVSDKGEIRLPIADKSIKVAALTPAEAASAIEEALKEAKIMRNPRVLVTVQEY